MLLAHVLISFCEVACMLLTLLSHVVMVNDDVHWQCQFAIAIFWQEVPSNILPWQKYLDNTKYCWVVPPLAIKYFQNCLVMVNNIKRLTSLLDPYPMSYAILLDIITSSSPFSVSFLNFYIQYIIPKIGKSGFRVYVTSCENLGQCPH